MREHFKRDRILRVAGWAMVVELGLVVLVKFAPALGGLFGAGTAIVAVSFGVAMWHASREREGDRRTSERRRG